LGALPAAKIEVVHDGLIQAVAPAGSPGLADLRVIVDGHQAKLKDAFNYLAGKVQLFAVSPTQGAIAGNTWVTLYGTDFPNQPQLFFGEQKAKWAERLSPTTIFAKS
ncbi:MAG TPA: hypothetical protein EYN66_21015, partial [Myxococcales bacterium]|nr:hypothetical protein [Myxococcales bacterium]